VQVEVEVSDRVGTSTLNRPEARNALSGEVTRLLDEAIVELDRREDVGAIILTGSDPAFCAGFDLRALAA
jgi:enoyl-CoA hydratase